MSSSSKPTAFPFTVDQGFLLAPENAPDEVIDARHYRAAMAGLEKADAAFKRLFRDADAVITAVVLGGGLSYDTAVELGITALGDLLDELRPLAEGDDA